MVPRLFRHLRRWRSHDDGKALARPWLDESNQLSLIAQGQSHKKLVRRVPGNRPLFGGAVGKDTVSRVWQGQGRLGRLEWPFARR